MGVVVAAELLLRVRDTTGEEEVMVRAVLLTVQTDQVLLGAVAGQRVMQSGAVAGEMVVTITVCVELAAAVAELLVITAVVTPTQPELGVVAVLLWGL
jgi:hypothetical protein